MKQPNEKYLNQSILKAAAVLDLFSEDCYELGITSIAAKLDMPISTTHRILTTLEHTGYISQNPENGRYHLGIRCYMLGAKVSMVRELSLVARPYLNELSNKYNETANLYIATGGSTALCTIRVTANRRLFTAPDDGHTVNLHTSACGKCILAFLPPKEQKYAIAQLKFQAYTPHSIMTEEALREELEQVRQQRYATEREEGDLGVFCLAAPIFGGHGTCVAAASLSMPVFRVPESLGVMRTDVMEAARKISNELGYQGD
jgi:IclR family KDG regulon transcriptional repressor